MAHSSFRLVLLACISLLLANNQYVEADCTVKNDSGKKVIIVPVDVDVTIDVDVGASVQVPPPQQKCYFKNPDTGNQQGPFILVDGNTYVCKDGAVQGSVDVYFAAYVSGVLQLILKIIVSL
ncbi:hypothetical protein KP509_14G018700 [Ceratopteris richardii]|uniref:Uncharacterized protein n=1 Tax=Ceratopteris richardii TaxID=49495 RepID=A0A8T2TCR2_CERRI|nr:hypothetical protein KP509_14G018700 [Ceratopteris richardii]